MCPTLPTPNNGDVRVSGVEVGGIATYSCDVGFRLVGNSTRVCQDSVTWSGEAPVCSASKCDFYQFCLNSVRDYSK